MGCVCYGYRSTKTLFISNHPLRNPIALSYMRESNLLITFVAMVLLLINMLFGYLTYKWMFEYLKAKGV